MNFDEAACTPVARRALFFARGEALNHGGPPVEPEHLLLGLVSADSELLRLTSDCRFDVTARIRASIESLMPLKPVSGTWPEVPHLSISASTCLVVALNESRNLGHTHIGSEHILLGLLAYPSAASQILNDLGFSADTVRDRVRGGSITPQIGQATGNAVLRGWTISSE